MLVKITLLNNKDFPIDTIEGKTTGGSISVDGSSAVRRICSLSLVTQTEPLDTYWCFNTKFKLEVKENDIWFNMGTYLITSFSWSRTPQGITISLQGKDKMCRLNGDIGGHMPAEWDWGQEEIEDLENEITTLAKVPIRTIVFNLVRQIAQENIENIIIRDLEDVGYELWSYLGKEPMYYLKEVENGNIEYVSFDPDIYVDFGGISCKISEIENRLGKYYSINTLDRSYNNDATQVRLGSTYYYVIKIEQDETAGYHQIDLVYSSDLIATAGETATSVLDKIISMLGNYEYFYDVEGHFIFQKKKDYVQELFSTADGALSTPSAYNEIYSYRFDNDELITSKNLSPALDNVKNDFIVWGNRSEDNLAIHARCAIDTKPTSYSSPWEKEIQVGDLIDSNIIEITGYGTKINGVFAQEIKYEDTEKGIKMNVNFKGLTDSDTILISSFKFPQKLNSSDFPDLLSLGVPKDKDVEGVLTGSGIFNTESKTIVLTCKFDGKYNNIKISLDEYQEYIPLTDAIAKGAEYGYRFYAQIPPTTYTTDSWDWRELIYQMAIDYRRHGTEEDFYVQIEKTNSTFTNGKTGYEQYYIDLEGFWRVLYNPFPYNDDYEYFPRIHTKPYWNTAIHYNPNSIIFWFDFLDTQGEVSKYSVREIGDRTKVIKESTVTSVYNKETPEVQFIIPEQGDTKRANVAYAEIQIPADDTMLFYKSAQGASAIGKINELINAHMSTSDTLSMSTCAPIYDLPVNTRIYVKDLGDFTVNKITYNLNYNGTTSISANKIYKDFY